MQHGTFEDTGIRELLKNGRLVPGNNYDNEHVQPASVDLTFEGEIYHVAAALPPKKRETVADILRLTGARLHNPRLPLQVGEVYMAKASVGLNLSPGMHGVANPKSTTGRLFANARVIGDHIPSFDRFDKRHAGLTADLWITLEPMCFDILPSYIERYAQLRISNAREPFSNNDLLEALESHNFLFDPETGAPYPQSKLSLFTHNGSIRMTLSARGTEPVGFRAKRKIAGIHTPLPINLEARGLDPRDYFEPIYATQLIPGDERSWGIWLEAGEYYILSTYEILNIPKEFCLAIDFVDPEIGELASHYAGFVDPGWFGNITLEACAPRRTFLRHKSPIATGVLSKMRRIPEKPYDGGSYPKQRLARLPKQFLPYPF